MRNLIRKILKEEVGKQIESIEYIGCISNKKIKFLKEQTNYDYIDQDILNLINNTFIVQQKLAKDFSPLEAEYQDLRTGQTKRAYFNIIIDKHFSERNFRPETFPEKGFVDVGIDEGINILVSNINNIWKLISVQKLGFSDVIRLKTLNGMNYEILVSLTTPGKLNKLPIYDITLFNQMKGPQKHFKKEKTIINVYNPIG
jgi:hypothetical protein